MSRDASIEDQVRARLAELSALGVDGLPRIRPAASPATTPRAGTRPAPSAIAAPADGAAESAAAVASLDLGDMALFLTDCRRCRLCEGRTQVVFGVGDPRARLMFVGEAPGRDEDLQGEPFVGRAGQLLTDMIEKGMRLRRSDVYIANVVKCRPPENRNPEPDEIAACGPFLRRQVALVRPEIIVALGRFAAHTLLQTQIPIGKLRGNWHQYEGIALMPTFHPSYLLRSPGEKRVAWEDLKAVMARLGSR